MSILDRTKPDDPALFSVEADVILTSAVVGFSATRIYQNQPFSFDIEHPTKKQQQAWQDKEVASLVPLDKAATQRYKELATRRGRNLLPQLEEDEYLKLTAAATYTEFILEWGQFLDALSAIAVVLKWNGLDPKPLKDAQSPQWEAGSVITGRAGGAMSADRHVPPPENVRTEFLLEASVPRGYKGRGAYTGTIGDPVRNPTSPLRAPTQRLVVSEDARWHPQNQLYWGLIDRDRKPEGGAVPDPLLSRNLLSIEAGGMGPFSPEWDGRSGIVGYVHGMISALVEAARSGPWCTPYEIAAGSETTKLASCFLCTMYMFAAGYPPSSIHLGRGESWHPPAVDSKDPVKNELARSMNTRWHVDVFHYLTLGCAFLEKAKFKDAYATARNGLAATLKKTPPTQAGNLLLDALTVHNSEWKRVERTLMSGAIMAALTTP